MTTKIIKCTCKHDAQDKIYGVGNRVANEMRTGQFKCTVCGVVQGNLFTSIPVKVAEKLAKQPEPSSKAEKGKKAPKPKVKRGLKWGKK